MHLPEASELPLALSVWLGLSWIAVRKGQDGIDQPTRGSCRAEQNDPATVEKQFPKTPSNACCFLPLYF